jgi:heme exporter protein A
LAELLSASDLCLIRGDRCLFQEIGFSLGPGELLSVAGANGSGKTSLLRAIAGLLELEAGEIRWQGHTVDDFQQQFRASLVWFAHRVGFKGDLTPLQNLRFEAGLRAFRSDGITAALARVGVTYGAELPMRALSAGQQRRVGLARLILADAPFWMMDEPFTNLDTDGQGLVRELISEHLANGGICAIASHQAIGIDAPTRKVLL